MSIIKRKSGSEDIVKSVLEFDEVPTEGSHNLVESGSVAQAIGNLGHPLQWKGPATVSELNAGIENIQPGWTYTLTDAGTLTDGSIDVEAGDEVAWTEDGEWFSVGSDTKTLVKDEAIGLEYVPGTPAMVGDVYMHNGIRYKCNTNNMDAEWTPSHWTALPVGIDIERLQDAIGSVNNGGALTDDSSILLSNNSVYTLSTAQSTLELSVVVGSNEIPNFAVEITPSVNVTLTVTKTVNGFITTLSPSVAGGNTLTSGKKYQVTCVGSCWTLAEFEVPTP